jgi:hypothetical protein
VASENDVEQIRRRMAQIRRELHEDVREVVASAEAVTDWHRYIRKFPWVAIGLAAGIGYLIVPRRHRKAAARPATGADVAEVREAVEEIRPAARSRVPEREKKGLIAMGVGLLGPVLLRAAQGYAVQYLENWIVQQQQQAMAAGPPPPGQARAPGGPGRPSGTPGF